VPSGVLPLSGIVKRPCTTLPAFSRVACGPYGSDPADRPRRGDRAVARPFAGEDV
jgi:hypothetical protein